MQPPFSISNPAIVHYLGVLDQLDSSGWDELVRLGRASVKQLRSLPDSDALHRLPDLSDVLSGPDLEGPAVNPFEHTNLPPEYADSIVGLYQRLKTAACRSYGTARPVSASEDEDGPAARELKAQSDAWAGPMEKATHLAAQGGALLALSPCKLAWAELYEPWKRWVDARPEFNLFRGGWSSLVHLGPVEREGAVNRGRLRGLFHRERPVYGPGTKEVLAFLDLIPRLGGSDWEHLQEDADQILVGIDWADGAYAHALKSVVALGQTMSNGHRWLVESEVTQVDEELESLSLTGLRGPLVRAYAAAGRRCIDLFVDEPADTLDERKLAAGCCALLLASKPCIPAEDWERLWGGPLL
jgi:hypothetical protein